MLNAKDRVLARCLRITSIVVVALWYALLTLNDDENLILTIYLDLDFNNSFFFDFVRFFNAVF